jgi:hypothetical protein
MKHQIYYCLIPVIFLFLSCTRRNNAVDFIGLKPIEYHEDNGLKHSRVSILYSKDKNNQDIFELICHKLNNEFTQDKGYKVAELHSPLEESRKYYANKEASAIFKTEGIGEPLSLFQIENKDFLKIVIVYDFKSHVGVHIAGGS